MMQEHISDTPSGSQSQVPDVSPRFAAAVPTMLLESRVPRRQVAEVQDDNPESFAVRELTRTAATNPDGTPRLASSDDKVTPLTLAQAREIVAERRSRWDGMDADGAPFEEIPRRYRVRDNSRYYAFTGVRLSLVSSENDAKPRWTDIAVYRTNGGMYVVHRVAVTTVVHHDACPIVERYHRRYANIASIAADEFGPDSRVPCSECMPTTADSTASEKYRQHMHTDPASLRFERDRHVVAVVDTPEDAIQALHTVKRGEKMLGPLAGSALTMAADRDPYLSSVWYGTPK